MTKKYGVNEQIIGLLLGVSILFFLFPIIGWLSVVAMFMLARHSIKQKDPIEKSITFVLIVVGLFVYHTFETIDYFRPEAVEFVPNDQKTYIDYLEVQVIENRDDIAYIEYQWSFSRADKPDRFIKYVSQELGEDKVITSEGLSRGAYYLICKITFDDGTIGYADTDLIYISGELEK